LKILLTNDDGIAAPGLWAAANALSRVGEVFVVAPDKEQSGVGASLTLHSSVRVTPEAVDSGLSADRNGSYPVTAYSVEGTPGDSCILALENLVGAVDLVVSGINAGSNLGWDVLVSGTVGAAIQGYVRGYPTIAISVGSVTNPQFETSGQLLGLIAQKFIGDTPGSGLFLNVNLPSVPADRVKGLRVTQLGNRSYGESVREEGAAQDKRYRISRNRPISGVVLEGTDIWALKNNYISITPLQFSLTHQGQTPEVEAMLAGISDQLLTNLARADA